MSPTTTPTTASATETTPEQARPCAICGAAPTGEHALRFSKSGCAIHQCAHCGTAFAVAKDFSPETYYTEDYFNGGHTDGYGDYLGSERVLAEEFARTAQYLQTFVKGGHLLELGCAYGLFLQQTRASFKTAGIEIASHAAQHCQSNGLDVTEGVATPALMASLAQKYGQPDVMVMLDVIEHIPQPDETLALMARSLKPGGHVLITTGDWGSWVARLTGKGWRLMTPPQHLWFFSTAGMTALAQRHGLEVVRIDHPWKRVPLSLIAYQLLRMVGLRPKLPAWLGRVYLPVNLFDAMRVVLRKPA